MQSLKKVFSTSLEEENGTEIINDLVFELSKKRIQRLKDKNKIQNRIGDLFEIFCEVLREKELHTPKNIEAVIDGLLKAVTYEKEDCLYKTLYQKEQLEKSINEQKRVIKDCITDTYATLDKHLESIHDSIKQDVKAALSDIKLNGLEMLGILKETTEEAILTTLEKGSDIEDTIYEISKNLTYQSIKEGSFTKSRFLNVSKTILEVAKEIADQNISFAKEIINGSIEGTKDGILKAINKFKNDIKFAPEEIDEDLNQVKKELMKIEDDYIEILKHMSESSESLSSKFIKEKLEKLDGSIEKLKRATNETREILAQKIEELKSEINIEDLKEKAEQKFENLKKDVASLEKKAEQKFEEIKQSEKTKQVTQEAKKLGLRAWEVAKNILEKKKR